MARLLEIYKEKIIPELVKRFKYKNNLQAPKLKKIVVNMGVSGAKEDIKILDEAMDELAQITGQRPAIRRAKKSVSNFKLRKNMPIGCKVTIRGKRMYEFLDRLINASLPRIRDFRGVSPRGFDEQGNYNLGIAEHVIFPEIKIEKVKKIKGMNISICTDARNQEEAFALLDLMGMPFRKEG